MNVRLIMLAALLLIVGFLTGCRSPVIESHLRSPYDRYAIKRGQQRPAELIGDTSGTVKEQLLRERLRPLGP